ncbi:dihydropteroate synthase [Haloferax elongans ATCC BAA-1513]|uniref:Dihydropteroate synthase n=1 Tax=Haloferax elongans ATCC BAA-1513 TaxID=1230453 RepID=M0HFA2_HALEO|nr:dihydropteroate synthase [Haloferax elongans]ELZ83185.1 dihydropteroate synthase [Haloferax elongans ATCC BAA-1513]
MRTVELGDFTVGDGYRPRIMGVLNMSPSSGWKPSMHAEIEDAARFAEDELIGEGADIVDIGLQSANIKYDVLPAEKELERLDKAVAVIDEIGDDAVFSIETRYADVAEEALTRGFDIVNDVAGFADPRMREVCEDYDVPNIKMASPPDRQNPGAVISMEETFAALERGGFTDKTILDPSFGKWTPEKTFADDRERFRRLREFRAFNRPLLTATNREDFLGDIAGRMENEDQLPVSLAAATMEVERGAHIIRTHDVAETRDVALVAHALGTDRLVDDDAVRVVEYTDISRREAEKQLAMRGGDDASAATGVSLSFVAEGLEQRDIDALESVCVEYDVPLAPSESAGVFLSGSVAVLKQVADEISGASDNLTELAGSIRRAATKYTDR